jgi:uncharacterized membrane protein YkvA (DUF1232 family)
MIERLKAWARRIKRDVLALYLAARDPATSWYVKGLALCIAGYALSPIDLIPDFIPVLGLLDEAILLPVAIMAVVSLIPPDDMTRFRADADAVDGKPISLVAAAIIALIWGLVVGIALWFAYQRSTAV